MNSISLAVAGYQAVNNFYIHNFTRAEAPANVQEDNAVRIESGNIPTDDNAAYASISPEAIALYNAEQQTGDGSESGREGNSQTGEEELTQQEQREVSELKTTDAEVKAHENAHKAAAAGLSTSAPNYEYETGPDGKKYAVAGDVNVSYQSSSDPEVNLKNAQQLRAAALAPADPSSQDRKVAMQAEREIAQARQEILEEQNKPEEEEGAATGTASAADAETPAFDSSGLENTPALQM